MSRRVEENVGKICFMIVCRIFLKVYFLWPKVNMNRNADEVDGLKILSTAFDGTKHKKKKKSYQSNAMDPSDNFCSTATILFFYQR